MTWRGFMACGLLAGCAFEGGQALDPAGFAAVDGGGLPDDPADAATPPTDTSPPGADAGGPPDAAPPADTGAGEPGWMVVDTVEVPSGGDTVSSAVALAAGATYRLRVTGSVEIAADVRADADWYWDVGQPNVVYDAYFGTDIGITLDGQEVAWGEPNLAHTYVLEVEGGGAELAARFLDVNYDNNSGTLLLEILAPTPLP